MTIATPSTKQRKLTKKERGFVHEYARTENGTQSALKHYNVKNKGVAGAIATENLKKPQIIEAVKAEILSLAQRIPDNLLVEKHLELLNAQKITRTRRSGEAEEVEESVDTQAVSKGLDMAYRLKGAYAAEKHVAVNFSFAVNNDDFK